MSRSAPVGVPAPEAHVGPNPLTPGGGQRVGLAGLCSIARRHRVPQQFTHADRSTLPADKSGLVCGTPKLQVTYRRRGCRNNDFGTFDSSVLIMPSQGRVT